MLLPLWGLVTMMLPLRGLGYDDVAPTGLDTSFFLVYDVVAPMELPSMVFALSLILFRPYGA